MPKFEFQLLQDEAYVQLGKRIGAGSFGEVYTGTYLCTPVAIKKIMGLDAADRYTRERAEQFFLHEMVTLGTLRHPNIVAIIAYNTRMLIMPLATTSLAKYAEAVSKRPGRMSYRALSVLVKDCCAALLYLHLHFKDCVTHSDIKPDNILLEVSPNGQLTRALLGDVGLARACVNSSGWRGTPGFMPMTDGDVVPAHDVYATAVSVIWAWVYPMPVHTEFRASGYVVLADTTMIAAQAMPMQTRDTFDQMLSLVYQPTLPSKQRLTKEYSILKFIVNEFAVVGQMPGGMQEDSDEEKQWHTCWSESLKTIEHASVDTLSRASPEFKREYEAWMLNELQSVRELSKQLDQIRQRSASK